MTPRFTTLDTPEPADSGLRGSAPQPAADWAGVPIALRRQLEQRLKPGERVLWVQQAQPSLARILLTESPGLWVAGLVTISLAAQAFPMETSLRPDGATVLSMGGTRAFLWKDGDLSALCTGAIAGCAIFLGALLFITWQAFKTSRLWKEVHAVTNRRFLHLHTFLLDSTVDAIPLSALTVCNRVQEGLHRADIFISYPRSVTSDHTYGAPAEEVIQTIRLRGILSPETVERLLREASGQE